MFWLELGSGIEPLARVLDKPTGYRQLAEARGDHGPALFVLPSIIRERHVHAQFHGTRSCL